MKLYPMSVLSLLHLGAQNFQLTMKDLEDEAGHFTEDYENAFMMCGLPAPGLFFHNFKKMDRTVCSQADYYQLFKCTVLQKVGDQIHAENILHYCAKKNDFLKVQAYLEN